LELLRITEENTPNITKTIDITLSNMLRPQILVENALKIVTPKSMISDPK